MGWIGDGLSLGLRVDEINLHGVFDVVIQLSSHGCDLVCSHGAPDHEL